MKYKLTQNENSDRLILIFAGWSTDAVFYADICMDGYDVGVVWDYSDLDFPIDVLDGYSTICLFAWSLGVFAATVSLPWERISLAVAINGTPFPADDSRGIPETVFLSTLDRLDDRNLLKFRKRMVGKSFSEISSRFSHYDIGELKQELRNIHDAISSPERQGVWDRIIISSRDLIFPPDNMKNAWKGAFLDPEIKEVDAPHFINLNDVISGAVPRREKVGERFRKSIPTYDASASVQRSVAQNLVDAIPQDIMTRKVLEIGPGSGLLTYQLSRKFHLESIDFIDLFKIPRFGVAEDEKYYSGDAEDWMDNKADTDPGSYDLIVSASAMQWFVNPERFLKNCRRLLRPGGTLACATYLPGTLGELDTINPFGLVYRSQNRLNVILGSLFGEVSLYSEEFKLNFNTAKEALRHLLLTGVGGSSSNHLPLHEMLKTFPKSLTYLPLYIIAQ